MNPWSDEEIASLSKRFHIQPNCRLHPLAEDFHFPRRSFLKDGYAPPGGYVKDFCFIQHDGRWHLFHIDGRPGEVCWISGNEISFGHASTTDFVHWVRHEMPLSVGDRVWESEHVWAPYVHRHGELFYMFYMGIGGGETFISYATSRDLEKWTKWKDGPIRSAIGRDPFIFNHDGEIIMLYTGHGFARICGCATKDMLEWRSLPDILTVPGSGAAESVSVHPLNDGYVLWFNDYIDAESRSRVGYVFSKDPLHFESASIRDFRFETDHPDAVPSPEAPTLKPFAIAIELIARRDVDSGENKWLVSYFRWQGDRNRLFFGEIDWSFAPAVIREIIDPIQLQNRLKFYSL